MSENELLEEMKSAYKTEKMFHEWVDAYSTSREVSIEYTLLCATTREVFKHYKDRGLILKDS